MVRVTKFSPVLWIRSVIPLACLGVIGSTEDFGLPLMGLFLASGVDVAIDIGSQLRASTVSGADRWTALRDIVYALIFYALFLGNPGVPALLLAPPALAEVFLAFGARGFIWAIGAEALLLALRMATINRGPEGWIHPGWAVGIASATLLMGLLAYTIARLNELQAGLNRQRHALKEALTELLATMMSPMGIGENVLKQEQIRVLLEELCQTASRSKGAEAGRTLARIIARRQEAFQLFTPREFEVLCLLSENKSYRQIAQHLQISEGTVRAHVAGMMRKTQVHSREELTVWARKHCLVFRVQGDAGSESAGGSDAASQDS
ncbi:MAG: response regulator transcription factor [Kyrpidia tusciae]|nr:LuxR C-terminal-related transcriptional regulator [Kyrpidia tusciae]MBE3551803.1 response regulator transcription factor [Kyrpidia tusciae]